MCVATELCAGVPVRARGLTLVELMVALVIGLLISLAAALNAQQFLASQRQSVGVGGASMNAISALAAIKNDIANGGLGFMGDSTVLCTTLNFSQGAAVVSDGANFAPVQAARVGDNDVLDIVYGNQVAAGAAVNLALSSDGTAANLRTLLPVAIDQIVLLSPPTSATPCLLRSVTASVAPTADARQVVTFGAAGNLNQVAFTTSSVLPADSRATLFGTLQWNRYSVVGGNLVVTRVLTGESAILVRNVIGFRVEYGISAAAANSSTLEDWQAPGTFGSVTSANIRRVRALRVGIVVRSPQREKVNTNGDCEASAEKPSLFGVAKVIQPDVADWPCYRYRSTIIVAPMRNIIYGTM